MSKLKENRNSEIYIKFINGFSLSKIAKEYGITKQRVQQIIKKIESR